MGERRRNPNGDPGEDHTRTWELLGPYVLGALDSEEELVVERHLEACAACRDEERGLRETHERLSGTSIAASSIPPDLKARVEYALHIGDRSRATRAALLGATRIGRAALAAAVVLVLFALVTVAYSAGLFDRTAQTATLQPTELAPGAGGELEVRGTGQNAEASVEVWGLPETQPDEYYELWFGREEGRVSAGTFTVDDRGWGRLSASAPEWDEGYQRAGITLERFPEEPRMDSARVVLRCDLQDS
jgi:anti-sigma-K factor RskA